MADLSEPAIAGPLLTPLPVGPVRDLLAALSEASRSPEPRRRWATEQYLAERTGASVDRLRQRLTGLDLLGLLEYDERSQCAQITREGRRVLNA